MIDRFNVVSVGTNDEGGVVVGTVVRPQPRRGIVVLASGGERATIEFVDLLTRLRGKGKVHSQGDLVPT
jgi:hypothetical protein